MSSGAFGDDSYGGSAFGGEEAQENPVERRYIRSWLRAMPLALEDSELSDVIDALEAGDILTGGAL